MANEVVSKQQSPAMKFVTMLDGMKDQFKAALPKHIDVDRYMRLSLTVFRTTPKLQLCDPRGVIAAIMTAAQMGLEIGVGGQAYLIPFRKGKGKDATYEAQLIPGYRGLIKMMYNTGEVDSVYTEPVYTGDHFKLRLGLDRDIEHEVNLDLADRGKLRLIYAVAKLKSGGYAMDWMTVAEIDKIRARSRSANDGPWVTDTLAMQKKTVLRRLAKLAPYSIELHNALVLDAAHEAGRPQGLTFDSAKLITMDPLPEVVDDEPEAEEVVDTSTGEVIEKKDPPPDPVAATQAALHQVAVEQAKDPAKVESVTEQAVGASVKAAREAME